MVGRLFLSSHTFQLKSYKVIDMNGIHDMGGMTCFGQIENDQNEPVFHDDWERKVLAITIATSSLFGPLDKRRYVLEKIDPIEYLRCSYYERWLVRLEHSLSELGIDTQNKSSSYGAKNVATNPNMIERVIREGRPSSRKTGRQDLRFSTGDFVRAKNISPTGHTRLARYVRGRRGVIFKSHGTHCFPDTTAHGAGENPQPLYSVRFSAEELWGSESSNHDMLFIDLWEDYLEPCDV